MPGIALARACRVLRVRGGAADACRWLCARVAGEHVARVCDEAGVGEMNDVAAADDVSPLIIQDALTEMGAV